METQKAQITPRRGIRTLLNNVRAEVKAKNMSGAQLSRGSGISHAVANRVINNELTTIAFKTESKLRKWLLGNNLPPFPRPRKDEEQLDMFTDKPAFSVPLAMAEPDPHGVGRDVLKVRKEIKACWKSLGWERDNRPDIGGFADELRLLRAAMNTGHELTINNKLESELQIKDEHIRILRSSCQDLNNKVRKLKKQRKKLLSIL